jgi:LysR family transcriptional regulator for metE and metH
MELDIRHLKLVLAVAECGSLTRAGERLFLTQSALSHQLRDIESRLSMPLFLRVGKRMVLTPAGERLLASARRVLSEIDTAEDEIRRLADEGGGPLRITTECYTCYHWLPALLKTFRRKHPRVDVRIDAAATSRPIDALLDGRIELALLSTPNVDRRIVTTEVFRDNLVPIAAPGHPLTQRRRVSVEDLNDETLFFYPPKEESTVYKQLIEPSGVRPRLEPVQLTEAIVELVKAGLGVACLARWAVRPHLEAGTLQILRFKAPALTRRWAAASLRQTARLPFVVDFVELLRETVPRQLGEPSAAPLVRAVREVGALA